LSLESGFWVPTVCSSPVLTGCGRCERPDRVLFPGADRLTPSKPIIRGEKPGR